MAGGYYFKESIVGYENLGVATAAFSAICLILFAFLARSKLKQTNSYLIPDSKFGIRTLAESFAQFTLTLGDAVMGKENRKYLPVMGCLFVFLFFNNFLGIIPGFYSSTASVSFNMGLAIIIFIAYNVWGIKEAGLANYIKHFGMVKVSGKFPFNILFMILWLFIACVELISHFVRPASLSLRLYGNMKGDHAVLDSFMALIGEYGMASLFYFLGTFVSFMQAFIFTILSMVYIRLACAHDEDH